MSILKMLIGVITKRGGSTLVVWIALMMVTVLAFAGLSAQPLQGRSLKGMALTCGVVAIVSVELWRWVKGRRAPHPPSAAATAPEGDKHAG
jgi:hypothetical protein